MSVAPWAVACTSAALLLGGCALDRSGAATRVDAGMVADATLDTGRVDARDARVGVDADLTDATPVDAASADGGPLDAGDAADSGTAAKRDCLEIHEGDDTLPDGNYVIDPDGPDTGEPPFTVWCDMNTVGGGWTLVYAYTFTAYDTFSSSSNAITPRPSWGASADCDVPISTTAPRSLTDDNALDFARWSELGTTFLVRSNINQWVICREAGGGSLVREVEGSLDCRVIREVAGACGGAAPSYIDPDWSGNGPALNGSHHYYYFDCSTTRSWPTHDPCGNNMEAQLTGVSDPRGAILLRR